MSLKKNQFAKLKACNLKKIEKMYVYATSIHEESMFPELQYKINFWKLIANTKWPIEEVSAHFRMSDPDSIVDIEGLSKENVTVRVPLEFMPNSNSEQFDKTEIIRFLNNIYQGNIE
jgi:hypothetical protein